MKKYLLHITDRKVYTDFLVVLSDRNSLDVILKNQTFRCKTCGSFTVPVKPLHSALKVVQEEAIFAEELLEGICEFVPVEPWYLDLVDKPDEVVEKLVEDMGDYLEAKEILSSGEFFVEDESVYQLPYDECAFVFDPQCECRNLYK